MSFFRSDQCSFMSLTTPVTACFGGVQATTSSLQIWGDIFFKSQFVAFNGGNNTLGMAQHV